MPRHISLLFPGQGSQSLGMLSSFNNDDKNLISTISNEVLSFDLVDLVENGPEEMLNLTSYTQPAILACSYLYYKNFLSNTGMKPDLLAGHSLGEYSALVASNSIDFKEALKLVHNRGLFMEKCDSGSMYAILNLDLNTIDTICTDISSKLNQSVSSANINSHNQVVIAGNHEATQAVAEECKTRGAKRAIQLKVSVASHCELMKKASMLLSKELEEINFRIPSTPILHNINASESNSDIINLLTNQLTHPVQWLKTMEKVKLHNGIVIECGPGKVLTGLAKTNGIDNILTMSSKTFKEDFDNIYEQ